MVTNPRIDDNKVVVIGSANCGKTQLVTTFTSGQHTLLSREPSAFNELVFRTLIETNDRKSLDVDLVIFDTSGQAEHRHYLHLAYKKAKVIIGCFDISDPNSFLELECQLLPTLYRSKSNVYLILVGCKADLRPECPNSIPFDLAWHSAKKLGAITYMETSSLWSVSSCATPFQFAAQIVGLKSSPVPSLSLRNSGISGFDIEDFSGDNKKCTIS